MEKSFRGANGDNGPPNRRISLRSQEPGPEPAADWQWPTGRLLARLEKDRLPWPRKHTLLSPPRACWPHFRSAAVSHCRRTYRSIFSHPAFGRPLPMRARQGWEGGSLALTGETRITSDAINFRRSNQQRVDVPDRSRRSLGRRGYKTGGILRRRAPARRRATTVGPAGPTNRQPR